MLGYPVLSRFTKQTFMSLVFCGVTLSLTQVKPASAYCRTLVLDETELKQKRLAENDPKHYPQFFPADRDGCYWPQRRAIPSYWKNSCIGYSINERASSKVSYDQLSSLVGKAFKKWTSDTRCVSLNPPYIELSSPSIDTRIMEASQCGHRQFNPSGNNQNLITFFDTSWPYEKPNAEAGSTEDSEILGRTTTRFNKTTGEIVDGDMEFNSTLPTLVLKPDPSELREGEYDMESVITHEIGHWFGLGHSNKSDSVMYFVYDSSTREGLSQKRTLKADDKAGICFVYSPDGYHSWNNLQGEPELKPAGICDPGPPVGEFTTQCTDTSDAGICAFARAPHHKNQATIIKLGALLAACGIFLIRKRKPSLS